MSSPGSDGAARSDPGPERHELTLYVSGASERSARAIADARSLCEVHLRDRYVLAVIDIHQDPESVPDVGVVATPMLVKHAPPPERRIVGDLADPVRVLLALEIATGEMPTTGSR